MLTVSEEQPLAARGYESLVHEQASVTGIPSQLSADPATPHHLLLWGSAEDHFEMNFTCYTKHGVPVHYVRPL